MGVERTDYVVYGFRLTKEQVEKHNIKWTEDQFDPYVCGALAAGDYRLIVDQMCGEYMVFGKCIHGHATRKAPKFTIFDPHDFTDIDNIHDSESDKASGLFLELFGNEVWEEYVKNTKAMLIAFTHYN